MRRVVAKWRVICGGVLLVFAVSKGMGPLITAIAQIRTGNFAGAVGTLAAGALIWSLAIWLLVTSQAVKKA